MPPSLGTLKNFLCELSLNVSIRYSKVYPALGESIAGDHIIPAGRGPAGEGGGGRAGKTGRKASGLAGEGGRKQSRANTARVAELARGPRTRGLPASSREILGPGETKKEKGGARPWAGPCAVSAALRSGDEISGIHSQQTTSFQRFGVSLLFWDPPA